MQIAQANNAPKEATKSPQFALNWIAQRSRWLMVYDNADGHYSVVEKFLPPGNGGNILITSRNVGLQRLALESVNVLDMGDDEAVQLLLKSAMLDGTPDSHIANMGKNVISELGGIPLAVDQAGAYMQNCGCSIGSYLELFKKHRHQLMSRKEFKGASGYGASTYGTWDISIEQIEGMAGKGTGEEAQSAQCAIRLLRIFAFLDHENIPDELFKNAAENYIKRYLVQEAQLNLPLSVTLLDDQMLLVNKGEWDRMQFLDGIKILLSFSLIKAVKGHLYSMHPLVNEWCRHIIPKIEITDQFHRVRALLSCSIALDWEIDNYTFCKLLAPHIRANTSCGLDLELEGRYYDDEYPRFALVFHHIGSWNEEEKLLLVAAEQRKTNLGLDHPDTLTVLHNLASTYWNQGRWDEAEKLQLKVMNARRAKLGLDHPDVLHTMNSLATTYRYQGRWDEAEKLEVEVMNARRAKLGSGHPDTLTTMHNLAITYRHQGRWDEAEELQLEVMNTGKVKLGSDHPDTLTTMHNLALTYRFQGRWDEGEKLQVEVMNARKAKLGSDHPHTLTTMHNLALTYRYQGRWDEAEKLQVEVMNATKAKLGSDHPDTLSTMHNLASTYWNQGRWDESEKLQVEVMNASKAKLGSDHPSTLTIMRSLTLTYQSQGRWDEAEKLQVKVMNASKAKFGSDHPDTLHTMHNLASTYWNQGRWDEAEKLNVEVMNARKAKLGLTSRYSHHHA
jgi:tetratricopeptide (TPR) repeat protein